MRSDDDLRNCVAHIVIPGLECWLAERAWGGLVGMLVLDADWIDQLYVHPGATRAGIGADLITVDKRQ